MKREDVLRFLKDLQSHEAEKIKSKVGIFGGDFISEKSTDP